MDVFCLNEPFDVILTKYVIMKRLNPNKLHVKYLAGTLPERIIIPRRYTLTHSDRTGELFLSIGDNYNTKQLSGLYTRFMRDEVLAEFCSKDDAFIFKVYCHVSGGFVLGTAQWRYNIFKYELPLVLEAFRYGDRNLFEQNVKLDKTSVLVYFKSANSRFNSIENWGAFSNYR